jgi:Rrf2 family protein
LKDGKNMRFEVSTDYAIRALRLLHINEGEVLTTMEIAQSIGITSPIFSKIANKLRHAGMLRTIQGQKGGYVLGLPADEISIYEVYCCIEGDLNLNSCLETGERCIHGEEAECKVHSLLYGIQDEIVERLSGVFIADLA